MKQMFETVAYATTTKYHAQWSGFVAQRISRARWGFDYCISVKRLEESAWEAFCDISPEHESGNEFLEDKEGWELEELITGFWLDSNKLRDEDPPGRSARYHRLRIEKGSMTTDVQWTESLLFDKAFWRRFPAWAGESMRNRIPDDCWYP